MFEYKYPKCTKPLRHVTVCKSTFLYTPQRPLRRSMTHVPSMTDCRSKKTRNKRSLRSSLNSVSLSLCLFVPNPTPQLSHQGLNEHISYATPLRWRINVLYCSTVITRVSFRSALSCNTNKYSQQSIS